MAAESMTCVIVLGATARAVPSAATTLGEASLVEIERGEGWPYRALGGVMRPYAALRGCRVRLTRTLLGAHALQCFSIFATEGRE